MYTWAVTLSCKSKNALHLPSPLHAPIHAALPEPRDRLRLSSLFLVSSEMLGCQDVKARRISDLAKTCSGWNEGRFFISLHLPKPFPLKKGLYIPILLRGSLFFGTLLD